MSFSPVLSFYRAASSVLGSFAGAYLNDRAKRGKEDGARLGERFGRYTQAIRHRFAALGVVKAE